MMEEEHANLYGPQISFPQHFHKMEDLHPNWLFLYVPKKYEKLELYSVRFNYIPKQIQSIPNHQTVFQN